MIQAVKYPLIREAADSWFIDPARRRAARCACDEWQQCLGIISSRRREVLFGLIVITRIQSIVHSIEEPYQLSCRSKCFENEFVT